MPQTEDNNNNTSPLSKNSAKQQLLVVSNDAEETTTTTPKDFVMLYSTITSEDETTSSFVRTATKPFHDEEEEQQDEKSTSKTTIFSKTTVSPRNGNPLFVSLNNSNNNSSFGFGSSSPSSPAVSTPSTPTTTTKQQQSLFLSKSLRVGILPLIQVPFLNNRVYALVGNSWNFRLDFLAGSVNEGEPLTDGAIREAKEESRGSLKFYINPHRLPYAVQDELKEMWSEDPFEEISDSYNLPHVRNTCLQDSKHIREQILFLSNISDPPAIKGKPIDQEHFLMELYEAIFNNNNNKKSSSRKNHNKQHQEQLVVLPCPMAQRVFDERHVCVERSCEALEHNEFKLVPVFPPLSDQEKQVISQQYFRCHEFATAQQHALRGEKETVFFKTLAQAGEQIAKLMEKQKQLLQTRNMVNGNTNANQQQQQQQPSFQTPITWSVDNHALRRNNHAFWGEASYGKKVAQCAICGAENMLVFSQDCYCCPDRLPSGCISRVSFHDRLYFEIEISDVNSGRVIGRTYPRYTPVHDTEQEDKSKGFWLNFVGVDAAILKRCLKVPKFFLYRLVKGDASSACAIVKDLEFDNRLFSSSVFGNNKNNNNNNIQKQTATTTTKKSLSLPVPKSKLPQQQQKREISSASSDDDN